MLPFYFCLYISFLSVSLSLGTIPHTILTETERDTQTNTKEGQQDQEKDIITLI